MIIDLDWPTLKSTLTAKSLIYTYVTISNIYNIYAVDGPITYRCLILQDGNSDQTDFETNYKSISFITASQFDTDGATIVRNKAAKRGWTYAAVPFEFQTAGLPSTLYSKMSDGTTDRSGITLTAYDGSGNPVTTAGVLNANLATITETLVDVELPYDFELIGGELRTLTSISSDLRLWIIAVPDIPAGSGGSKEMAGGINIRYLTPGNLMSVDGRVSKYLTYSNTLHTNKLRFIFRYPAGTTENLQVTLELYRL